MTAMTAAVLVAKKAVKLRYECWSCGDRRWLPGPGELVVYASHLVTTDPDPDIYVMCSNCLTGKRR